MIDRNIATQVELTPEELAVEFCIMDNEKQCRFFNAIGKEVRENWDAPFGFQMATVIDCGELDEDGIGVLNVIKDFMEDIDENN